MYPLITLCVIWAPWQSINKDLPKPLPHSPRDQRMIMSDCSPLRTVRLEKLVSDVGGRVVHGLLQLGPHVLLCPAVDGRQLPAKVGTASLDPLLETHRSRPVSDNITLSSQQSIHYISTHVKCRFQFYAVSILCAHYYMTAISIETACCIIVRRHTQLYNIIYAIRLETV